MLRLKGLTKVFRTRYVETFALRDVSLEVGAGEFLSITGPSGSGKSTLLNVLGLLEGFTGGSYEFDGVDVRNLGDQAQSRLRNEAIGFVFQAFHLVPTLTASENVALPLHYRGLRRKEQAAQAAAALARVGLESRKFHYPAELSGGQQQRVAIARALVGDPKLLLADEPTGNLDQEMSRGVLDLLESINAAGTAVVLVTHDPELAAAARHCVHLIDGQVAVEQVGADAQ
jgi:putative ABC transport system ATP-binding protein